MTVEKIEPNKIELVVAAHVYVDGFTSVSHPLRSLLEKIKTALQNPALTTRDLRRALADWLVNGMAMIKDNCLRIMRAGRTHIEKLAELATSPAAPPLIA